MRNTTKAMHTDVGYMAMPRDSSYSMNLATFQNDNISGKQGQIISRPFKLKIISTSGRIIEREFVIIKWEKDIIRVINDFIIIHRK